MRCDVDSFMDQSSCTGLIVGCLRDGEYCRRRTLRIRVWGAFGRDRMLSRRLFDRALRVCVRGGLVTEGRDQETGRFLYWLPVGARVGVGVGVGMAGEGRG